MTTFVKIGATSYRAADYTVPADRTFRNAWSAPAADTTVIQIDMVAARKIWQDKIRSARKLELEKLDTLYMRALEAGNTSDQATIVAQKQALRDAPTNSGIAAATTPDELKAVQPIPNVTVV